MKELAALLNKTITLFDARTGRYYEAKIADVRSDYGRTRIKAEAGDRWFEPTTLEMERVTA